MNRDLAWIGKIYETYEIPKEKEYLLKYFETEVQRSFLRYYLVFGDYDNFVDHTGFVLQPRWLKILEKKFLHLEALRASARANMDLKLLSRIESGDYTMT